jgi:hypothetical protein
MLKTKDVSMGSNSPPSKRDKILNLQEYHKELFEKEEITHPKFIPRMCYKHDGELIIGFFIKEIFGQTDIYTEFCSRDYMPEDPKRTLWKWKYNPHFHEDYALSEPHPATGDRRYLIPASELINVTLLHNPEPVEIISTVVTNDPVPEKQTQMTFELPDNESDSAYSTMSIRDYAAIQWKSPVSLKPWLNELIKQQKIKDE